MNSMGFTDGYPQRFDGRIRAPDGLQQQKYLNNRNGFHGVPIYESKLHLGWDSVCHGTMEPGY